MNLRFALFAFTAVVALSLGATYAPEPCNLEVRQRPGIFIHWGIGVMVDCEVLSDQ